MKWSVHTRNIPQATEDWVCKAILGGWGGGKCQPQPSHSISVHYFMEFYFYSLYRQRSLASGMKVGWEQSSSAVHKCGYTHEDCIKEMLSFFTVFYIKQYIRIIYFNNSLTLGNMLGDRTIRANPCLWVHTVI